MRKSSGLMLLLLAGAGSATLYAKPQELSDLLGRVNSLSASPQSPSQPQHPRVFSPSTPLIEAAETSGNKAIRLAQAPISTAENSGRPGAFVAPLAAEGSRRLASSKPGDDDARRELTRDLQKELKRVGCFDGEVNGTWSPAAKKAMSAFMDRVNATLPVEEPDYILLTLVQGHSTQACGKGCPPGQGLSGDGRCQPRAILAQTARKGDDRKPVEPNSIQTGSLVKPPLPASSSWTTSTIASAELPKTEIVKPQVPTVQVVPPTSPLPGRMAMGAPVPSPEDTAKLDDIEARKRRAQAALIEEQKLQSKAQAEADRIKTERLNAEAQKREQQLKTQALAEAERQKTERATAEKTAENDRRDRQVAAADARRTAQRQAEALEANIKPEVAAPEVGSATDLNDAAKVAAIATAAAASKEASDRRVVARRARERDEDRQERERRIATTSPTPSIAKRAPPPTPRYVPTVTVARVAPAPTPRPKPEQRWTRTIFSDISRNSR
jgi:hypothetical protein